ncbi:uncharacterized protein METZ01_LOCUS415816, partial [marine metagenome]
SQGGKYSLRRKAGHGVCGCGLRHGQLVRARARTGAGTRARRALHGVFRYALRTHRAVRRRAWLQFNQQHPRHFPLEEHGTDQCQRHPRSCTLGQHALLDLQLAQAGRRPAHDRTLQARGILSAGILRLRLQPARHQRLAPGKRPRKDRTQRKILRQERGGGRKSLPI